MQNSGQVNMYQTSTATSKINAGISVIICCYNSVQKIIPTIEHLAAQQGIKHLPWEVLLIDNNSNDNTSGIALSTWEKLGTPAPLFTFVETQQGLTYSRKTGVAKSRYECIIFCDDDNWLDSNYLAIAYATLQQQPQAGIVGGWSNGYSTVPFPPAFESMQYAFAVGKPHASSRDITDGWQVWGAGMVARKTLLQKIFDPSFPFLCTDRAGKTLSSGGDDEICARAILLGYKLYFSNDLHFTHFINPDRLTPTAIRQLQNGFEHSVFMLKRYQFCIAGIQLHHEKRIINGLLSILKATWNYIRGHKQYSRCHLDTFAFYFQLRSICDKTSGIIFDFAKKYHRF